MGVLYFIGMLFTIGFTYDEYHVGLFETLFWPIYWGKKFRAFADQIKKDVTDEND